MKLRVTWKPIDHPERSEFVPPRVAVDFERTFNIGLIKAFIEEQRVEHIMYLAWAMEVRRKEITGIPPWGNEWLDFLEEWPRIEIHGESAGGELDPPVTPDPSTG